MRASAVSSSRKAIGEASSSGKARAHPFLETGSPAPGLQENRTRSVGETVERRGILRLWSGGRAVEAGEPSAVCEAKSDEAEVALTFDEQKDRFPARFFSFLDLVTNFARAFHLLL